MYQPAKVVFTCSKTNIPSWIAREAYMTLVCQPLHPAHVDQVNRTDFDVLMEVSVRDVSQGIVRLLFTVRLLILLSRTLTIVEIYISIKKTGYMITGTSKWMQKLRVRLGTCKTGLSPPVTLCY